MSRKVRHAYYLAFWGAWVGLVGAATPGGGRMSMAASDGVERQALAQTLAQIESEPHWADAGRSVGGATCPVLPEPAGRVVEVSTEPELARAVRDLESGVSIVVTPGTYRLANTLHVTGGVTEVAVRGRPGRRDDVVLQGPGMANPAHGDVPHGFLIGDASDVLIADLTIRDVYYHAVQIQGEQGAHDVRLYNLRLVDAGEQFVKGSTAGPPGPYPDGGEVACSIFEYSDRARSDYTNGVDVLSGADWVVRDNVFRRIRAPLGQMAGPTVLFWRNSVNTIVERNLLTSCDRGIAMGLSRPDPGLARDGENVYDHQESIVRNNMIYQPAGADTADIGITVNYARAFQVLHNTVIQNGTFAWGAIEYRFAVSSGEIRGNLTDAPIWQRDGATASLSDNLTDARLDWFVAAASADLHLTDRAARALDRAPVLAEASDDFDGEARPAGAAADIGADELSAAAPTLRPTQSATPEATGTPAASPTGSAPTTAIPTRFSAYLPACPN